MSNRKANRRLREAAPVFAALGDDVRLLLVSRLSEGVPLSITRLAEDLPITRQAVTKHLRVLESAGLVRCRRQGRERQWQLQVTSLKDAGACLDRIAKQWGETLGRLKAFIEG